jgi:hypothetical protein|tara:strand:+ start:84 stop:416 length:333 start_codon:yes stop_codon:yes gene_type:complete
MVTRNAKNEVAFAHTNGIAESVDFFSIDGGATLAAEIKPGEAMGLIVDTIATKTNILAVGAEDGAGAFRVMVHGGGWTAADLQTAIRALGSTAGSGDYDATGATVADFAF